MISLVMITRGEEGLSRAIESALPLVTEVVLCCDPKDREDVDTRAARFRSEVPIKVVEREWDDDFAAQRNFAFSHATQPHSLWIDSDDELRGAADMADELEKRPLQPYEFVSLDYYYEHDDEGNPRIVHSRERIVPTAQNWKSPIHEIYDTAALVQHELRCEASVKHLATREAMVASNRRNIEIMKATITKDDEMDYRVLAHLGQAYLVERNFVEALRIWQQYSNNEEPGMRRAYGFTMASEAAFGMGDLDRAYQLLILALGDYPHSRATVRKLFDNRFAAKQWAQAMVWFERLAREDFLSNDSTIRNPNLEVIPWRDGCTTALRVGDLERACEFASYTKDQELIDELTEFTDRHLEVVALTDLMDDKGYLGRPYDDPEVRKWVSEQREDAQAYAPISFFTLPILPEDRMSVAINCSIATGSSDVNPDGLEKGVGGSEEAVISVARGLARRGAYVEVFRDHNETMVDDAGVVYRPFEMLSATGRTFDALIHWRQPHLVIPNYEGFQAVWCHDVLPSWRPIVQPDEIWVLSDFHAAKLKEAGAPPERLWQSTNGVRSGLTAMSKPGDPNRLIFCSSPDRGLDNVAAWWDDILAINPDAKLDIFYGFTKNWMQQEASRPHLRRLRLAFEQWLAKEPKGVKFHGFVGAEKLHDAMAEAGVWFNPSAWPEISCINAMKAQALGCHVISSGYGALSETINSGVVIGGPDDQNVFGQKEQYLQALKDFWADPDGVRTKGTAPTWDTVARQWYEHLQEVACPTSTN